MYSDSKFKGRLLAAADPSLLKEGKTPFCPSNH